MGNWLLNLPVVWMAVVIFAGTYLLAALIHWIVMSLAVEERARAFKRLSRDAAASRHHLRTVGRFIAAQVWSDFERAKVAVATEASSLRTVNLLAAGLPAEPQARLRSLIAQHVDNAVNQKWPAMAEQHATLSALPTPLIECLRTVLAITPADEGQRTAHTRSSPHSKPPWRRAASASSSANRA